MLIIYDHQVYILKHVMILSMSLLSWLWEFLIYLPRLWFLMQNNTMVGMVVPFCVHPGLRLPNNARIYLPRKYVNEHTMM